MGEGAGVDKEEEVDKGEGGIKGENIVTGKLNLLTLCSFQRLSF